MFSCVFIWYLFWYNAPKEKWQTHQIKLHINVLSLCYFRSLFNDTGLTLMTCMCGHQKNKP